MEKSTGKGAFSAKLTSNFLAIIVFILVVFIQFYHVNMDFWNDEIYTLKHFILTPVRKTLTDYHVPNNHILFNLINNVYLKTIGLDNLRGIFEEPWKLRIVPLVYSMFTVFFVYKIASVFIDKTVGLLAVIILVTSLPFYNFSLQIRGYGLSMTFSVALVYYLLSYLEDADWKQLCKIVVLALGLFYIVPSNLYFLCAVIFAVGVCSIYKAIKEKDIKLLFLSRYSIIAYVIVIGALLGLALYLPIFNQVFSNEHVHFGKKFDFTSTQRQVFFFLKHLFYNRLMIISVALIGGVIGYKNWLEKGKTVFLVCLSILVIPFVIVFVTGQSPPERVYTYILPFVSLLMALGIVGGLRRSISSSMKSDIAMIISLVLLFSGSLYYQLLEQDKKMLSDTHNIGRSQDLYHQYYSARYSPLEVIKSFKVVYENNKLPVVLTGGEPHGIPNYLTSFSIDYISGNKLDSLLSEHDSIYVFATYPSMLKNREDLEVKVLNKELSYHNHLLVGKKKK